MTPRPASSSAAGTRSTELLLWVTSTEISRSSLQQTSSINTPDKKDYSKAIPSSHFLYKLAEKVGGVLGFYQRCHRALRAHWLTEVWNSDCVYKWAAASPKLNHFFSHRITRLFWGLGLRKTLLQIALFTSRFSNQKINSMLNLQVSKVGLSLFPDTYPSKSNLLYSCTFSHFDQIMWYVKRSSNMPCWHWTVCVQPRLP